MAPKEGSRKTTPSGKSWSTYPTLHDNVNTLLEPFNLHFTFHNNDNDTSSIKEYDTNIVGHFKCSNNACSQEGWGSKVIAITIRMYANQRYNARVYHQRCRSCNNLSKPFPDGSYAERITYRLKVWNGVDVVRPFYAHEDNRIPHESSLCEGCKHGHCRQRFNDFPF